MSIQAFDRRRHLVKCLNLILLFQYVHDLHMVRYSNSVQFLLRFGSPTCSYSREIVHSYASEA